jgi:hypothetical protein
MRYRGRKKKYREEYIWRTKEEEIYRRSKECGCKQPKRGWEGKKGEKGERKVRQ